jgi:type IV pilus assembly protein PilW
VWEERKRTTSSGSDAQVAGTIAMYNLDRDIRQGGFGFGLSSYMGCTVQAYDTSRATPAFTFNLYPVQIVDGASGAPDEIRILYGTSTTFSANQTFTTSTATAKKAAVRAGFNKGDLVIVAGNAAGAAANCHLVEITGNTNADGLTLDHASGTYTNYLSQAVTARYNNPAGTASTYTNGGLHNLGPGNLTTGSVASQPRWNIWQLRTNNTLSWSDALHDSATWFDVAEGIVNLQAQYGVDANNDNLIDSTEWTITTPSDWTKVRAIRVGLLARSQQYDKLAVTATAPSWGGGAFTMANVDGTTDTTPGDANDWRHYRYRVYEKVIPLRNLIWGTAP